MLLSRSRSCLYIPEGGAESRPKSELCDLTILDMKSESARNVGAAQPVFSAYLDYAAKPYFKMS